MNLGITGLGMITALGRDAATSCASIRAGLSRPREIHDYELIDPDTLLPVPLVGHPLRGFSEGFNMVGLWLRLARPCLRELTTTARMPGPSETAFWADTALIGVTPYINDDRFMSAGDEQPELITSAFLLPLLRHMGLPIPPANVHPLCNGQGATASAVALADRLVSTTSVHRVIVLGVDSYLDSFSVEWLARHRRLKAGDNPTGLMPGEAGACFLLEKLDAARRRDAVVQAVVEGVGVDKEKNNFFSGANNRGISLAHAVRHALQAAGGAFFRGDLISDHNGEEWRALELAGARMLLRSQVSPEAPLTLPAACLGDVGAASGAVIVGVAVRAFARKYAAGERTLTLCSSDHGDVGALLLRRAA